MRSDAVDTQQARLTNRYAARSALSSASRPRRPSASPSLEDVPVIEPQAAELLVHYDSRAVHYETLRFEV